MSDLPFRPGEDISRLLPILRVEGFEPGAPEVAVLANHFAGSLRQFYHGQAQLAAGSKLTQWAKSVDRGDHQIRYVNQSGMETVTLHVHPKVVEEVLKKPEPEVPWDWAVVDFEVPLQIRHYVQANEDRLIGAISGFYIRCQQVPFERDFGGVEMGGAGTSIAWIWSGEGAGDYLPSGSPDNTGAPMISLEDPVTAYSEEDPIIYSGVANIDKRSVRIDLRQLPAHPELTFEVYANLYTPDSDFYEVYTGKYQGAKLINAPEQIGGGSQYHLYVQTGYSAALVYELYPNIEAMVTSVNTGQPAGPKFGKTESEAASVGFAPIYGDATTWTWTTAQQYFFENELGSTGWGAAAVSTPVGDLNMPDYQAFYQPVQSGDSQNPVGVPEMGVGVFKWVNTAWDKTNPADGIPYGSITLGVIPDPPAGPGEVSGGPPGSHYEYTVFYAYVQHEWFIFLPNYGTQEVPITVNSTMTVSAAMFRGTPPWEAPPYDIPDDPGEWAYSQWQITGQAPRFRQAQIGAVPVEGVQLDVTIPAYPDNYYYEPKVQRDGRPYIGLLTVSPTKGYATFKPA